MGRGIEVRNRLIPPALGRLLISQAALEIKSSQKKVNRQSTLDIMLDFLNKTSDPEEMKILQEEIRKICIIRNN